MSDSGNKTITGPGAPLKRDTLKALDEYRQAHGAGCWVTLAEKAGVTEEDIANIRQRLKVPMEIWKKVARALGIKEEEYT